MKETKAIKPIQTFFDGRWFRSKLEAQWAVFFKSCGIKYEYESEGYVVDGETYLPDFYLPDLDIHCEVKGKRPGYEDEVLRTQKFITWGGPIKVLAFLSNVPNPGDLGLPHFPSYYWDGRKNRVGTGWLYFYNAADPDNPKTKEIVKASVTTAHYPTAPLWDNGFRRDVDVSSVSDAILEERHKSQLNMPIYEYPTDKDRRQSHSDWVHAANYLVFDGLKKARYARWGHGEHGDVYADD